jgi:hypothetical protein
MIPRLTEKSPEFWHAAAVFPTGMATEKTVRKRRNIKIKVRPLKRAAPNFLTMNSGLYNRTEPCAEQMAPGRSVMSEGVDIGKRKKMNQKLAG